MPPGPFQPLPDATQPHVDRLLGTLVGEHRIVQRLSEGRFGTIYRCEHPVSGQPLTLQVLRTGVRGNDEEVRAANAIRRPETALVSAFGDLPDGRRYRVFEHLDGESLDMVLQRKGPLPPKETAEILAKVAGALAAARAWAIGHGCLTPSSVFLVGDSVKLIDFGLSKAPATPAQDLQALGALGFALLTGRDVEDGAPPPAAGTIPEPLERLLRDLLEQRLDDAAQARKELEGLFGPPAAPAPPPPRRPGRLGLAAFAVLLASALGLALAAWPGATGPAFFEVSLDEDDVAPSDDSPDGVVEERGGGPAGSRVRPKVPRGARAVPSARALQEEISKLEGRLRKQSRAGEDHEQALFVLNKQRLRLTGSPTVEDRRDVARQLRIWRGSYLKP